MKPDDEEIWLRHRVIRMRALLRFAREPHVESGLRELIADPRAAGEWAERGAGAIKLNDCCSSALLMRREWQGCRALGASRQNFKYTLQKLPIHNRGCVSALQRPTERGLYCKRTGTVNFDQRRRASKQNARYRNAWVLAEAQDHPELFEVLVG